LKKSIKPYQLSNLAYKTNEKSIFDKKSYVEDDKN